MCEDKQRLRILSLIPHFGKDVGYQVPCWEANTTRIDLVDRNWNRRNLVGKAIKLLQIYSRWDRIVFFYDSRLPMLLWFLNLLWFRSNFRERVVFTTWLCDTSLFDHPPAGRLRSIYSQIRKIYYSTFASLFRAIVVHSSAEVSYYATTFNIPEKRLRFIPYFARQDSLTTNICSDRTLSSPYVLAAGRHRDFSTYLVAVKDLPVEAVLIGGEADRNMISNEQPGHIRLIFEVPFQEYRSWVSQAMVFVVPLFPDRPRRSLGQIATFEAIAAHVPVIAARTFHLQDYFTSDEILFYEPGNPNDLAAKISRLLDDPSLRKDLSERAYKSMISKFTAQNYTEALLSLCSE